MKRTVAIPLATAALGGALLVAPVPAANAGNMTLTHHSPDEGYAEPFWVKRTNGQTVPIWPGSSVSGVHQVYVASGTQIVCYYGGVGWRVWRDATGWHDAGGSSQSCVNQLD